MILWLGVLWVAQAQGVLIERIVAVVDGEVITQSELLAQARIEVARRHGEAAAAVLSSEALVDTLLPYAINQVLIANEVRRAGGVDVPASEVERRGLEWTRVFRSQDAQQAFQRRFGLDEEYVRKVLLRDLRNDVFIARVMESRVPPKEDAEATRRARVEAVREWLKELREAAEIRVLGPNGLERQ